MSEIIQRATAAINGSASADELNACKLAVNEHRHQSAQRHADISEGGRARRQAVEAGDVEQVRKLDVEARELSAELEVIQGLQSKLQDRLDAARAREATSKIPKAYKALAAALEAERAALRALENARATTAGHLSTLRTQRTYLARFRQTSGQTLDAPPASQQLLYKFLDVRGITPVPGEGWGRNGHVVEDLTDCLGLEPLRPSKLQAVG